MSKVIGKIIAFVYCAAIITVSVVLSIKEADVNLIREVVIEAGSQINIGDFFVECPYDARFITDVSGIDTKEPAVYKLQVFYDGAYKKDVVLRIEDHTGPQGSAVPQSVYTTWKMPEAEACVDHLYDLSGIAKIEYQDGTPRFSKTGDFDVPVCVTDVYGNTTVIPVPFSVIDDHTPPVIKGLRDIEIGDDPHDLNLFKGVTVTDDYDPEPVLKVDDSKVNYMKTGDYKITYKAIDKAGNVATETRKIKVTIPGAEEENGTTEEDLDALYNYYMSNSGDAYELAESLMVSLWRDNDVETARAIFNWVHSNIYYVSISYYQTYEAAAYRGFATRSGDCYVYFSCCKMLLDIAGIPNMMVTRYPVTGNGHYWNLVQLNGLWYHCDATVFMDHPGVYFMCTDEEIDDYHHQFNGSLYPERAGGSKEYATPTPKATSTPRATPTPRVSPTPKVTPTLTPTATPSPTVTPVATITTVPTVSTTPDVTPAKPSDTPEPTVTETPGPTDGPSPTPEDEPEPTPSAETEPTEPVGPDLPDKPDDPFGGR